MLSMLSMLLLLPLVPNLDDETVEQANSRLGQDRLPVF